MPKLDALASATLECLIPIAAINLLLIVVPARLLCVKNIVVSVSTASIAMRFALRHSGNHGSSHRI